MPTDVAKKIFSAKVSSIKDFSDNVREITFKFEESFTFVPGQYVWIELLKLKVSDPKGTRRAFSIASTANKDNTISIEVRFGLSGYKKALFGLKKGDWVLIHGPFGSLQFPKDTAVPVVCVAGGVGVAPFVSLIPDSLVKFPSRKVILVTSDKAGRNCPYTSFFRELGAKNPVFLLTQVQGRISDKILKGIHTKLPLAQWVIAGPKEMVSSVASILYSFGINEEQITFDEFYISKNSFSDSASVVVSDHTSLELFSVAVKEATNHIILTDIDGYITYANSSAEKTTGYSFSEMHGQTPRLWGGLESPEFYRNLWHTIKIERKPFSSEIINRKKNGEIYYVIAHITPLISKSGNLIGFMGTEEDISRIKEIDRMKTEFVSLASHQLRTPLTAIKWGLEVLMKGTDGKFNIKQKQHLIEINGNNEQMIDLVNSLLNISRIESGRIIVTPQPTNIVKLAKDVVGKLKMELAKKNISLDMNVAGSIPEINLDQSLISNVYQNLITNSIYYSPKGSKVVLKITSDDKEIVSFIKDEGIGIPEDEKSHVFEKFYRAANAKSAHPDGNGLGLYIVKSIVESSGGKLWFESEIGKGSTFYFSLPLTGMKAKEGDVSLT